MATTINAYSVSLAMDASSFVDSAKLSRKETSALVRDLNSARTPAENFAREQDRLTAALNKGAISEATYNRLLDSKREKFGMVSASLTPYIAAVGAVAAAATAAVAGGVAFNAMLRRQQDEIDKTAKASTKLGVSYNDFTGLSFAASEIGGLDSSQVETTLKKFQINLAKAVNGDQGLRDSFARLGLDAGELITMGPTQAMMQMSDAMGGIGNHAEKLQLAMELFGKSGVDFVSTLDAGRDVIAESVEFQQKWGALTDAQVAGVEANNDAWGRVSYLIEGTTAKLAAEFAPAMQLVADYILDGSEGFAGIDGAVRLVVDNTVMFVGYLKDGYELMTIQYDVMSRMASLDFSGIGKDVTEALTFDSGQKALDALNAKRKQIEESAAGADEKRKQARQALELEDEDEKLRKQLDNQQKLEDASDQANRRLALQKFVEDDKAKERMMEDDKKRQAKIRDDVAKGPGSGMEVGSAEAAKYMADQVNAAIADALPTKGEQEIIAKQEDQTKVLKDVLVELKQNGFKRLR